jgi:hypothetical protein
MSADMRDSWMTVAEAYPLLRSHFRSPKTFRWHLGRRDVNGLLAADAVRMSPFRKLLVNPERIARWAIGEGQREAA